MYPTYSEKLCTIHHPVLQFDCSFLLITVLIVFGPEAGQWNLNSNLSK